MKKLLFFVAMFCSIAMTAKAATETCDCGSQARITATAKEGYEFVQWQDGNRDNPRVVDITGDAHYIATFAPKLFEISFKNWNGELLLPAEKLPYGSAITYKGSVPTKPKTASHTYTFKEWNPTLNSVPTVPAHDQSFTAVFDSILNEYTIYYKNYDGTILQDKKFGYGKIPAYENTLNPPTKPASKSHTYTFKCWSPTEVAVTGEATYVAQFDSTEILYDITFKNYDGTELATIKVAYDEKPVYPGTNPEKPADYQYSYTFSGWSPEITSVTGNATYTAQFSSTLNKYLVTFKDYDGTVIYTEEVEYGKKPNVPANPTRTATTEFTYTFAGWSPEVTAVTEDPATQVYTATYDATKNKYTITLTGDGGEYTGAGTYEYGTEVTIIAKPEGCKDFVKWSDGDTNATRKITVTGDATYTAEFEHITYTITVDSADETMGTVTIEKL